MATSWYLLPKFRERKKGVIINISSRAATVDFPFAVGYTSSKAAVARATFTLQEEVELDGLGEGVQLYALHPGGVPTAMAKSEYLKSLLIIFLRGLNEMENESADAPFTSSQRRSDKNCWIDIPL